MNVDAISADGSAVDDKTDSAGLDKVRDTRCDDWRIRDDRWRRLGSLHSIRR